MSEKHRGNYLRDIF